MLGGELKWRVGRRSDPRGSASIWLSGAHLVRRRRRGKVDIMPGKQARNNEPPLSRSQSQIAARILRQEFDPATHTHFPAESKPRLLAAVNAAFSAHDPPLPRNYSYRKMEDWRANCVYRHNRRQQKEAPGGGNKRKRGSGELATPPKAHGDQSGHKKRSPKTPPSSRASQLLGHSIDFGPTTTQLVEQQLSTAPSESRVSSFAQVLGDTTNDSLYPDTVLTIEEPCGGLYGLDAPVSVDPVWAGIAGSPQTQPSAPVVQAATQREESSLYWSNPLYE